MVADELTNNDVAPGTAAPLVELRGITKAYPGVLANDAVDLTVRSGSVHALLGENGAGKSTLVKVLFGLLQPDAGAISWQGRETRILSPAEARRLGIGMVFQHFSLFESLTVLENIALGMAVDADAVLAGRIVEVSTRYGLPLDPDSAVHTLSVGIRQRIEICRCLLQEPALLIMDEPTSVLTPQEVGELFTTLRRLASEGTAILYISHKLDEIRDLCDEATILRGGKRVASVDPRKQSANHLAASMMGDTVASGALASEAPANKSVANSGDITLVGREPEGRMPALEAGTEPESETGQILRREPRPDARPESPVRLRLKAVSLPATASEAIALHDISLDVHGGEIVGIAGVAGNGQDELMRVIAGEVCLPRAEAVQLDGRGVAHRHAGQRRRLGLGVVPEERLGHAAVPSMTLTENAYLTGHHRRALGRGGFLFRGASRRFATEVIERFDVRCNGAESTAASLSGGNLQKFVVGREILQAPTVLVVAQPTWGVDVGAAGVIHKALRELADSGAAVLVISQDLDELMGLSDRIGAICAGRLSALHTTASVGVREVGLLMGGGALAA